MRSNLMTLPQLHRSGRTSLVRLQIRDYRLVVLFVIEICTLFVCYACIGYFSRFAYAFTHIACFFMNLSIYRWFYRFFGFSLLLLPQLYRSDRTSHLIVTDQIQSVCRFICTRQSICLHVISFLIKLISSMLYPGYIHLADDVSLYYLYFGVLYLFCQD